MEYSYKIYTTPRTQEWDTFLKSFTNKNSLEVVPTTFIQSEEWVQFQQKIGRNSYTIEILDESSKTVAMAAAVEIRAKRGRYLYIRNGPIMHWDSVRKIKKVLDILKNIAKTKDLWFVRVSPLIRTNSIAANYFRTNRSEYIPCPMNDVEALDTWQSNIQCTKEEYLANLDKKTRYEINKAIKKGVTTEIFRDSSKMDLFYNLMVETVERNKWVSYSKEYIKSEFETFAKNGKAFMVLASYQNEYIAGSILVEHLDRVYYHYAASSSSYRPISAPYLVIYSAISEAISKEYKFFDFFGITPKDSANHIWKGLTQFKKKFSGFENRWNNAIDIPVNNLYWFTNIYEKFDKWRKGY